MYLWKDRRLRLNLTRLGMEYLAATVAVGLFAMNSGNNLLYLVFSLMMGLFLVSGLVSRSAIRDLGLEAIEEGNLFARVRGGIRIRLRDRRPGRFRALELRLEVEDGRTEPAFFGGGQGGSTEALAVLHARLERRGWSRLRSLEVRTGFPFGFIQKSWTFPLDQKVLVLPHPRTTTLTLDLAGELRRTRPAQGDASPIGARPFRAGDPLGRVHWKRTAQRGAPWVRTFEGEQASGLHLVLDQTRWPPGRDFERELERLSGAILQARLQRREVSLELRSLEGVREHEGHTPCWRALALAQAQGLDDPLPGG
ncbi:MAG: DUF58 domain-containing protein [Acidobacteria bacterium]|nr:DUF58 domain-containing protein [Acidobacteriota bacterium]